MRISGLNKLYVSILVAFILDNLHNIQVSFANAIHRSQIFVHTLHRICTYLHALSTRVSITR